MFSLKMMEDYSDSKQIPSNIMKFKELSTESIELMHFCTDTREI